MLIIVAQFSLQFYNESPKKKTMKTKFFICSLSALIIACSGYSQDSSRTRNDKPGTPQSLRTRNNSPENRVHLIETHKPAQQSIYHAGTESNKVNNTDKQQPVYPGVNDARAIPKTPAVTLDNTTAPQTIAKDSAVNKGTMGNGQSNASNPIRK